jgi:hypothetical protein
MVRKQRTEKNQMIKLYKKFTAIALWTIAISMINFAPAQAAPKKIAVAINSAYDFSGPYPFPGIFTISIDGAVVASGTVGMEVAALSEPVFHCRYTFVSTVGLVGTLIINEQCVFATDPWQGRWEIESGTGDFENLRGNGSALMPGNEENWVGFLH